MTPSLKAVLRRELRFFVRKVFATVAGGPFLDNWHIHAICHELEQVHSGATTRLLINQPPRSLKSICVSVAFVAWQLGLDPTRQIVVVSYSNEFAEVLHRQFRLVVNAPWYRELFPGTRCAKDTALEFATTRGGGRYATSVEGSLTGRGGDLIIIDDPLNASEALSELARKRVIRFYGGTLVSRLDEQKTGAIVVVAQRLHQDDLPGHLLEQGGWKHLDLPAIAQEDQLIDLGHGMTHARAAGDVLHPEREDLATLEALKREIGALTFTAQYLQRPTPLAGNLIKREWFCYFDSPTLPARSSQVQTVQSWDVAMATGATNDYSACTTWWVEPNDVRLLHVWRGRLESPDLRRKVIALAQDFRPDTILIEDVGPGMSLRQDLAKSMPAPLVYPIGVKPEGDKVQRVNAETPRMEAGHVHFRKSASWLGDLETELLAFPYGRHDDQVDSVTQFLHWWRNRYQPPMKFYPPYIVSRPRNFP